SSKMVPAGVQLCLSHYCPGTEVDALLAQLPLSFVRLSPDFSSKLADNAVRDRMREAIRSEEHTSELQSPEKLVCRLLPEKKTTDVRNKILLSERPRCERSRHASPSTGTASQFSGHTAFGDETSGWRIRLSSSGSGEYRYE